MGSYAAGAWAVELEPKPPLFSRLRLRPKRAAPAPQHWSYLLFSILAYDRHKQLVNTYQASYSYRNAFLEQLPSTFLALRI